MADAAGTRPHAPNPFDFSKVHKCKIYPGIGIARVGNSPDEHFIGPEAPRDPHKITPPEGSYKDTGGRIKRQAARFRIYAYDEANNNLGELPLGSEANCKAGHTAQVAWKVHLQNKKGAWYKFFTRFEEPGEVRNADIPVAKGEKPDSRPALVIDPGPRCIDGKGNPVKGAEFPKSASFDTGQFRGTPVPLGELKVDPHGRLLVLGGFGKSGSTKPDNPIGSDPTNDEYWADNDYWYDDVSDGPVTATVTLPNGNQIAIEQPQDSAWVIVAPPKYAPGIYSIVTLYDVVREVASDRQGIEDEQKVTYYDDIYPILQRAAETAWVNQEAQRGHGYDKGGDFRTARGGAQPRPGRKASRGGTRVNAPLLASATLAAPDEGAEDRERIFFRIRNPLLDEAGAKRQANTGYMPLLSGDGGQRTEDDPTTWLSLLPSQYRKFKEWKDGNFEPGDKPTYPPLERITDPDKQVEALQRGALEPCVGGAFYPGIEVSWIVQKKELYADAFRIDSGRIKAGDLTKNLALPWQADFYDCKDNWWPSARPDDVVPQEVFEEANKAWQPGQPPLGEALEGRVKWDRGLGVTTLFRRPWHNPAEAFDDPRDSGAARLRRHGALLARIGIRAAAPDQLVGSKLKGARSRPGRDGTARARRYGCARTISLLAQSRGEPDLPAEGTRIR